MPVPAIVGASLITALITRFAKFVFDYLLNKYTRRIATNLLYLTLIVTSFAGFAATLAGILQGFVLIAPEGLSKALALMVPAAMPLIMAAYATAHTADFLFSIHLKIVKQTGKGYAF